MKDRAEHAEAYAELTPRMVYPKSLPGIYPCIFKVVYGLLPTNISGTAIEHGMIFMRAMLRATAPCMGMAPSAASWITFRPEVRCVWSLSIRLYTD
jgi:hypothetical protein